MSDIFHLLSIVSNEDVKELLKFIQKHKSKFTWDSKIVDLVSKAIRKNDTHIFDLVIKYDIDLRNMTLNHSTILSVASNCGKVTIVEKLLKENIITSFDPEQKNSALLACFRLDPLTDDNIKCAKLLIKAGAYINKRRKADNLIAYQMSKLLVESITRSKQESIIRLVSPSPNIKFEVKKLPTLFVNIVDGSKITVHILTDVNIEEPLPNEITSGHILPKDIISTIPLAREIICNITTDGTNSFVSIYL